MSITQRKFLHGTAAASAFGVAVAKSATAGVDELSRLIDAHAQAVIVDRAKWEVFADITEAVEGTFPDCRVQIARMLGPRDSAGNETWTPIYSYSADDIDRRCEKEADLLIHMHAHGPNAAQREEEIRGKLADRATRKKAELAALEAERKRIQDESGYTAAEEAADASTSAVRGIEKEIIDLVPASIEAAARKAAWIAHAYREEIGSYLYDDGDEALIAALEAIGKAVIA